MLFPSRDNSAVRANLPQLEGVAELRALIQSQLPGLESPVHVGGRAAEAVRERIQRELSEEGLTFSTRLAHVLFQLLEQGLELPPAIPFALTFVLDSALGQANFGSVVRMELKLRALERHPRMGDEVRKLREGFTEAMGATHRLALVEAGFQTRPNNPADLSRYLQALPASALPALLGMLERIDVPENRGLICNALLPLAKTHPEPFIERLHSERPQTIRDMVYVLERSDHPDRIALFGAVLRHRNVVVRLETLNIMARGHAPAARLLIASALLDESMNVRMLAARLLPQFDRERALNDLTAVIEDPAFERRTPEEKTAFYQAMGSTALPRAIGMCEQLLGQKGTLLNRKRVTEEKLLAISGLMGACHPRGAKILEGVVQDEEQPPEVVAAARKTLDDLRRRLFGDESKAQERL